MTDKTNGSNPEAELPENERAQEDIDIAAELSALGQTIGEAIKRAWNSEERQKIETEVRDGLRKFAEEAEEAAKKLRESDLGKQVEEGAKQVRDDVQKGKVAEEVRKGTVQALRTLRDALDKMSTSFTPAGEDKDTPQE
jgi:hypothetical protein